MNSTVYIHYGATKFDPHRNFPIKNEICWSKPKGGLWASRKDASFGWKDWCAVEEFRDCSVENSFEFTIKDESKIAVISDMLSLKRLPIIERGNTQYWYLIDFEKCIQNGIDAIELCWYGDEYKKFAGDDLDFALMGWDCDSIVVLNPDAVIPTVSFFN